MNLAEHSPQNHSAPHGASQAASVSNRNPHALLIAGVLSVPQPLPHFPDQRFSRAFSPRALAAVLALGLAFEGSAGVQAFPRVVAPPLTAPKVKKTTLAPRAALMPRAIAPPLLPSANRPPIAATPTQKSPQAKTFIATPLGGGKIVRIADAAKSRDESASALAPAAPSFEGMKKVINVPSLTLPPLSKPLPNWMQNASVKVDRLEKKGRTRVAQNPAAAPVRNPRAPVTNSDRLPNQIEVAVSTFVVLLTTTDLQTVAIADPGIADVAVVNSRSVLLNGKSAGVTSLVIVDGQKIRQYTVRVTPQPGLQAVDVAQAIALPGVSVRPLRDALVLEGEVASPEEARRAVEIAGIYSAKVINQLTIRGQNSPEAVSAATLRELLGLPNVNVRVSGDTAILTGTVDTPQQAQEAEIIARTAVKNVLNLLKLPTLTPEQVRQSLGAVAEAPAAKNLHLDK